MVCAVGGGKWRELNIGLGKSEGFLERQDWKEGKKTRDILSLKRYAIALFVYFFE